MPLTISVIVPVFNRHKRLELAIGSIFQQVNRGDYSVEIIVVDDGSPEPIRLDYHPSVKVLRQQKNEGAAAARNTGVQAATGDLIAFLDSDDVWLPNKLTRQIDLFKHLSQQHDPTLLTIGSGFFDPNRRTGDLRARLPQDANSLEVFASGCWFCPGSTLLLSRKCFDVIGPLDATLRRLEDFDWFVRFGVAGGKYFSTDSCEVVICPSRTASFSKVMHATDQIGKKFGPNGKHPLPRAAWNRLAAYLSLEKSVANFGAKIYYASAMEALKSVVRRPRLRPAILPFWTESRDIPHEVQRIFEQMRDLD